MEFPDGIFHRRFGEISPRTTDGKLDGFMVGGGVESPASAITAAYISQYSWHLPPIRRELLVNITSYDALLWFCGELLVLFYLAMFRGNYF